MKNERRSRIKVLREELAKLTKAEHEEAHAAEIKKSAELIRKRDAAHDSHSIGVSYRKIARMLGVCDQTAKAYVQQGKPDGPELVIWSWLHKGDNANPLKQLEYGAVLYDWLKQIEAQ